MSSVMFFGASKFSLLGSGYLCVFDGCLVHEFLTDGDGALFEIIVLGKDPWLTHGRFLDAAVNGEGVLNMFCIVKDMGARASEKEHLGELGVDRGDNVVVHWWEEARDLVEWEDRELEGGDYSEWCNEPEERYAILVGM